LVGSSEWAKDSLWRLTYSNGLNREAEHDAAPSRTCDRGSPLPCGSGRSRITRFPGELKAGGSVVEDGVHGGYTDQKDRHLDVPG